jgi:hypothetical protein
MHKVRNLDKNYRILILLVFAAFSAGCASLWTSFDSLPMHRQVGPLPTVPVCRVAVLPFLNDSEFPFGDALVQKVFSAQFQQMNDHRVIQEGEVAKVYQQLHLLPGAAPSLEQYRIIADRVGAQLLLTGIVLEMRETPGEHQTVNPQLILEIQLRDAWSGEVLWTTFHRREGTDYKKTMHFGTIHTVTGLCRQMAEEIFNLWRKKGFAQCNG